MKHDTIRSQSAFFQPSKDKIQKLSNVPLKMCNLKLNDNLSLPYIVKNKINKIQYRTYPKRKILDTQLWKARITESGIQQKIDMQRSISLKDILKLNSKPNLELIKRTEYVCKSPRWSTSL
ncbi:unnamed protein product [Blepharisma stoltei]|uniref:Uncharacterized protein n=1 Tax=Blepharisma stoltei TaxID=1481888 RepID=A0AAU9JGD8_9CILI|nr:unnamed protein product [Blepharisma stoltei]